MKNFRWMVRLTSILFIVAALIISIKQNEKAQQIACFFSDDIRIAGIPVNGLDLKAAQSRLEQVYESPIEIIIEGSNVLVDPNDLGLDIHYENMISEAASACYQLTDWQKFWNFLWNRTVSGNKSVEFASTVNEELIRNYVNNQIVPRYTFPAILANSISGSTEFQAGSTGKIINFEKLIKDITSALASPTERVVLVETEQLTNDAPGLDMIESKLKEIINLSGFNGLVSIYLDKLPNDEALQLPHSRTISISTQLWRCRRQYYENPHFGFDILAGESPFRSVNGWINYMIVLSENAPADRLLENIDPIRGPLVVTEDMQLLGLNNTFIAGYFYFGSPLLKLYETSANTRTDVNLDPDLYNQTTAEEIGSLLSSIYQCAAFGSGKLLEKSNGSITQDECNAMIDTLARNKIGALIEAGVPEGTIVAHKHGWSEEQDGLLHTVSDVAIVFGPENDYVLTIFVYSHNQLLFDDANFLIAKLSQATYNGLNPNHQIPWLFDTQNP